MKRICLMVMAMVLISTLVFGASIPLKATWTPNTDSVTIGYKLYRTDGSRQLVGTIVGKTPAMPYLFSVTIPDGSTGTMTFVLTAYSTTKESGDSTPASLPFDLSPVPAVPMGFGVSQ
jgi:hypothetical protein